MARTAYHYVKTLDFASDVALGMGSLSPKFVSSPLPKDSSRLQPFRADVADEVFGQSMVTYEHDQPFRAGVAEEFFGPSLFTYGQDAPICTGEVTPEHKRETLPSSNAKDELSYNPQLETLRNTDYHISGTFFPAPGNGIHLNSMNVINFGIISPSKVLSSKAIEDFNNNYDSNYHEYGPLKNVSNTTPGSRVECKNEFLGQNDHMSSFIKSEPIGVSEYSLLEKGVECFLKKCKEEVVVPLPQNTLTNYSTDVTNGICKNEPPATLSRDDTGIGSLEDDNLNLTISDDSLDGKGIQYVSELKGTILRIKKLSKEADKFRTTPTNADLEERMMDFEINLKYLKLQAKDLKKRIKLRNRRVTNPYWSRSCSFNKQSRPE